MRRLQLFAAAILMTSAATAQLRLPRPKPRIPVHPSRKAQVRFDDAPHWNRAAVCLPGVFLLTPNGGISFGLDYERYLTRNGAVSLGAGGRVLMGLELTNSMVFVGFGPLGQRVAGGIVSLGGAYHPLGNRRRLDPGLGAGLIVGRVRTREENGAGAPFYLVQHQMLTVPLAACSLNVNTRGSFVYGLRLRGGPVLNRGRGGEGMLEAGLRIGTQF